MRRAGVPIKAVVLDCDGVILESTDIKTEAFRDLFAAEHPGRADEILAYHLGHLGVSRLAKLRHICRDLLGEPCPPARLARLARRFSRLAFARVLRCPLVPGAREFLRREARRRRLYVASGTPQAELENTLRRRGLRGCFAGVFGAPARKPDVIRKVLRSGPFRREEVAFVGDAPADLRAAREAGVVFVRRTGTPAKWPASPCRWNIRDLRGLSAVLRRIEGCRA